MTVRGPETRPTAAHCPADGEWIGIRLSIGNWLRPYPAPIVRDRRDVDLADVGHHSFRLDNGFWEYPTWPLGPQRPDPGAPAAGELTLLARSP